MAYVLVSVDSVKWKIQHDLAFAELTSASVHAVHQQVRVVECIKSSVLRGRKSPLSDSI